MNLRPIRNLYTVGAGGEDPEAHTRATESRFEAQLALGLRRFHDEVTPKPCFVFHPMNPLSQERPVIGIDHRIGKRDKVASLLGDLGQSENCTRIDELTAEWPCGRLRALREKAPEGAAPKGTDEE